ncbi:hypothetical protein JCM19235_2278 [Vibrio maritimus]|uniref:Uncharacterized protein n=1 Tax=Vibrio maritimus TaxID=990268 RepID=A0A090RTV6_9VIBR|nr:hypothetical protein JCM19235_2278 [Vibrio maritimus]
MKRFFLLAALLPPLALAHSQTPREIKKFVATENVPVAIDVTNLNDYTQTYEVIIEGKVVGTVSLKPDETRKIQLNLKVTELDKWTHKIVSTRSIPEKGQTVRTEIESLVRLYRPTLK